MLVFIVLCLDFSRSFAEPVTPFHTGPRLEKQFEQPVTVAWSNVTFREAVESLSNSQHVAFFVDRRVDPDASFSLAIGGDSLRIAILKIADQKGTGSTVLSPVVYLGPKAAAESLKTLSALRREEIGKVPAGARKLLTQSRSWKWEDLSEPRNLLAELGKEAKVEIQGLDQVPHDLWHGTHLPALPWCDRMTLILLQFGLTFHVAADGRSISLIPIPEVIEIERTYAGGEQPDARAQKLAVQVPTARISVQGDKVLVSGREEDHEEIAHLLSGRSVHRTIVKPGHDVYKLNVSGVPLKKVLSQVGTMLKLDVKYDDAAIQVAGLSLDKLVTFQVENATLDELLTAVVRDTGLTFERREKTVTIKPRSADHK